jgi:hypothetical protein
MKTHTGGCHCGRIAYEVDADITKAIDCNCSMCGKRGGLLAFVPAAQMRLKTDEADMATYTFNKHALKHHFCATCGIAPLSRGTDRAGNAMFAVNVRCLDGFDLGAIEIQHVDGRSF